MAILLPTKKTPARQDMNDFTFLIYGDPKVGKSTFASTMEKPIFLATEAGLKGLDVYQVPVTSWETLLSVGAELAEDTNFRTIVIDTVDNAYEMCFDYICEKYDMAHPKDIDFGIGYKMIAKEFARVLGKLALLNKGLVLISHSKYITLKTKTAEITRIAPSTSAGVTKFLSGFVDIILYAEVSDEGERIIRTDATPYREGGGRLAQYFPDVMPLDFKELDKAFKTMKGAK